MTTLEMKQQPERLLIEVWSRSGKRKRVSGLIGETNWFRGQSAPLSSSERLCDSGRQSSCWGCRRLTIELLWGFYVEITSGMWLEQKRLLSVRHFKKHFGTSPSRTLKGDIQLCYSCNSYIVDMLSSNTYPNAQMATKCTGFTMEQRC